MHPPAGESVHQPKGYEAFTPCHEPLAGPPHPRRRAGRLAGRGRRALPATPASHGGGPGILRDGHGSCTRAPPGPCVGRCAPAARILCSCVRTLFSRQGRHARCCPVPARRPARQPWTSSPSRCPPPLPAGRGRAWSRAGGHGHVTVTKADAASPFACAVLIELSHRRPPTPPWARKGPGPPSPVAQARPVRSPSAARCDPSPPRPPRPPTHPPTHPAGWGPPPAPPSQSASAALGLRNAQFELGEPSCAASVQCWNHCGPHTS